MKTQTISFLLIALGTSACADGTRSGDSSTVRDSAGIEIVESRAPAWNGEDWQVADEPTVRIGLVEGDPAYLFANVEGAVFLADGRIAVADRGSSQLRFYSSSGAYERFAGGPGEGPGELGYIRDLERCGADSLYVFEIDYQNVVFGADGQYLREARPYDQNSPDRRPYLLRCATNGYYAAVGWEDLTGPPTVGFYRAEARAWILAPSHSQPSEPIVSIEDAGLSIITDLGPVLSSERVGTERGSRPHPFGRATQIAITPTALYLGTGETPEVRRFTFSGRLERIVRWSGEGLEITEADIAAYREAQLAAVSAADRPAVERGLRELPMPPALPAFQRIEADSDGNLWVQRFRRPGETSMQWLIFDPDGVWLGSVRVPAQFEITDIANNRLLGIARDDLGVERVLVYEIIKPAS
jgi:hypothetical protein